MKTKTIKEKIKEIVDNNITFDECGPEYEYTETNIDKENITQELQKLLYREIKKKQWKLFDIAVDIVSHGYITNTYEPRVRFLKLLKDYKDKNLL